MTDDDDLFGEQDEGATPLTPDEQDGLIPTYITTRAQLNEAEHLNIAAADDWAFRKKRDILDIDFMRALHKRMYGKVWEWAGEWTRQQGRRIGVDFFMVEPELRSLVENVQFWLAHQTFTPDEIAARFHHKLTWIHPFPNGNGRFARMATDLLLVSLGRPPFTWGGGNLVDARESRRRYIAALRAADAHDIAPLMDFVRS